MTELPTIQQALAAAKRKIGGVGKNERNQQQGWSFRGIDSVLNAVSGPLTEEGIIVIPQLQDYTYNTVEIGRNATKMGHVVVKIKYVFMGPKGDFIETQVAAESMDSGDKAMTKAHSVALRTALIQTLSLPTDEPDPDQDIYERSGGELDPKKVTVLPPASKKAPENATAASAADIKALVQLIKDAKTTEQLNAVWKQAGQLGALQQEGAVGITIQQMMYDKGDAIKSGASSNGSSGRKTAAAK